MDGPEGWMMIPLEDLGMLRWDFLSVSSNNVTSSPRRLCLLTMVPYSSMFVSEIKVWFQEKVGLGKVLDLIDLEDLNDDFILHQLVG